MAGQGSQGQGQLPGYDARLSGMGALPGQGSGGLHPGLPHMGMSLNQFGMPGGSSLKFVSRWGTSVRCKSKYTLGVPSYEDALRLRVMVIL
jgi:hypothetical protein